MRVLGIDPGLTRCGVGLIDIDDRAKPTFVHVDVVRTSNELDLSARLGLLHSQLKTVISDFGPDVIAIERVFSQLNVKTAMGTAQASAVAMLIANEKELPVHLYTPTEVKAAVTGSGRADKKQVTQMVTRHLKLTQLPKPADAADALALALCHAWRGISQERIMAAARKVGVSL
jgi:crossover junction endodeoxyribonuclease RuvC